MTEMGSTMRRSIKAARIGVAMGSGTEVAENAGGMILDDEDFATIVRAVSEGRKLNDKLNKYVRSSDLARRVCSDRSGRRS